MYLILYNINFSNKRNLNVFTLHTLFDIHLRQHACLCCPNKHVEHLALDILHFVHVAVSRQQRLSVALTEWWCL